MLDRNLFLVVLLVALFGSACSGKENPITSDSKGKEKTALNQCVEKMQSKSGVPGVLDKDTHAKDYEILCKNQLGIK